MMTPLDVMWVGLGGGAGSLLRWRAGAMLGKRSKGSFPLGTFVVNIVGALAIGYLSAFFDVDWHDRYGTALKAGLITGVLGGLTTFSSMQLDASKLVREREGRKAIFYLLVSVACGLVAAAIGVALARATG